MIATWQGTIATIPEGWALCDGTQGTPDLRNQFAVPAGPVFPQGDSGLADDHDHTFTGNSHVHVMPAPGTDIPPAPPATFPVANFAPTVGMTDLDLTLPTYYSLAFIMKLGD